MKNFRDLKIWKKGLEIVISVYNVSKLLPNRERYGLSSQLTRSAVSIPSNIAEGCGRNSEKDFSRFLSISLGSSYELETVLLIIVELEIISDIEKVHELINIVKEEQKMISALINKISF